MTLKRKTIRIRYSENLFFQKQWGNTLTS